MRVIAWLGFPVAVGQTVAQERFPGGFQLRDFAIKLAEGFVIARGIVRLVETVGFAATPFHVGRGRPIVLARLAIDTLPLVAAMIDALRTTARSSTSFVSCSHRSRARSTHSVREMSGSWVRRLARDLRDSRVGTTCRAIGRCRHSSAPRTSNARADCAPRRPRRGRREWRAYKADARRPSARARTRGRGRSSPRPRAPRGNAKSAVTYSRPLARS